MLHEQNEVEGSRISVEKATATGLSEPDWEAVLEIVEEIKSKGVRLVFHTVL